MSAKSDFGAIYVDVHRRGSFLVHAATTLKRVFAIERTPLTLTIQEERRRKEVSNALKTRKNRATKGNVNMIRNDMYDLMTNKPLHRRPQAPVWESIGTI
jgi:hypothetical protein